jgi:hypothetical protein
MLQRYPGLDLYRLGDTSRRIGARARGAYWLTFLGPPLLGQLGGRVALRELLPPAAPRKRERWPLCPGRGAAAPGGAQVRGASANFS